MLYVGCDLVNWLHTHVQGLSDRREARKYASAMLHAGLIRHTVNKTTFSEQCYYTLGDIVSNTGKLANTLRTKHSGAVYCNRSCLWQSDGRAGGVCYHDNSKLCASIFTKLGL